MESQQQISPQDLEIASVNSTPVEKASSSLNKKYYLFGILAIVILLILGLVFYKSEVQKQNISQKIASKPVVTVSRTTPAVTPIVTQSFVVSLSNNPSEIVNQLVRYLQLGSTVTVTESGDFWIGQDNQTIPLKGSGFDINQVDVSLVPSGGIFTDSQLIPLETAIQKYFKLAAFQVDSVNTVSGGSEEDFTSYHRFGFVKENIKCVVNLRGSQDPFGTVFCGTIDAEQLALQEPFYSLFNTTFDKKSGYGGTLSYVTVSGVFAKGQAGSATGFAWLAKEINGKWQIIWEGQQAPLCSEMQKYQVPQDFSSCMNQ